MSTKPTRKESQACDQLAQAILTITQADRLDVPGKLDLGDLEIIVKHLAKICPAIGVDGIIEKAIGLRVQSLGLPSSTMDLLSLVEDDIQPLKMLLLGDEEIRGMVERANEELGDV